MVSHEISNMQQGNGETSCLLFDSFTDTTGVKSVLSLARSLSSGQEEEVEDKEKEEDVLTGSIHALRVPVVSKEEEVYDDQDSHLSRPMRSFLLFLRDVAQALEFISENIFNGGVTCSHCLSSILFPLLTSLYLKQ